MAKWEWQEQGATTGSDDTANAFIALGRVNSVITGFEAGRNSNGDMVSNVAASLFYALRDTITAQAAERERLALAICGGEDAPGYANSQTIETLEKVASDNRKDASATIDRLLKAEAALAAALARVAVLEGIARLTDEIEKLSALCDCDCDGEDCVRCSHYPAILENKRAALAALIDKEPQT